jgi:Flp pilus assembly pilin Flp
VDSAGTTLILLRFWRDESAQDLIEYSLLMAFVALCVTGLIVGLISPISGIMSTLTVSVSSAKSAVS